ncbi:MAG: M56 family metallopeptidase [Gimesia chilikensis]|uniref:M56 family metallopeptidase n=1 Tax=Gimesia chilikensis TaxID=2605989 RepID=UPI0037BDF46B
MDISELLQNTLLRLTLLLAVGWLVLYSLSAVNPRWSVFWTRFLSVACLLFPLVCYLLPPLGLAILPPVETERTEAVVESAPDVKPPAFASQSESNPTSLTEETQSTPFVPQETPAPEHSNPLPLDQEPEIAISSNTTPSGNLESNEVTSETPPIPSTTTVHQQPASDKSSLSRSTWLVLVWLAGVTILLIRLTWQVRWATVLRKHSELVPDHIQQQCQSLADRLHLKGTPRVRYSTEIESPCTAGIFRPVIYLPHTWFETLSAEEQSAILMHELAHVAGRDVLWNLVTHLTQAVYWFHPLVWRLPHRHRLACEHLSDAHAADAISSLSEYRRLLAHWALRRQGAESRLAALAMADRSQMLQRLKWLERPADVDRLPLAWRYGCGLLAFLSAVVVATVHFSPQVLAQKPDPPQKEKQAEPKENTDKPQVEKKKPAARKVRKPGKPDINLKQTSPKIVKVVDEQDHPIAGAKVRVGWWEDNEGDMLGKITINPPITNQKGEVTIQVPEGAARAQISAEAEGYAKAGTQYSLNGNPKLVLQPGRIIRVKAVDAKGNRLPDAFPLLEDSHVIGREFKQDDRRLGFFTSPVVKLDRRWMRVVASNAEGPVLFSHLIDVTNPERVEEDGTIVAILEPGIRLEGRLDDSVPRPIQYGCVELYINEGQDHKIDGSWTWQQSTSVKPDGTFVFDSLPTGGTVQLFALVDGYQSTRPTVQSYKNYLELHNAGDASILDNAIKRHDAFWPHLFPLTPGLFKTEVELPCTPTTSLDVKVVDPIGHPIEGAEVKFNPNGLFFGGELFIPATESLTMANQIVSRSKDENKQRHQWAQETFLNVKTDAEGIARVRNLPADDRESYRVSADGYQMPVYPTSSLDDPSRYALIDLAGGQTLRRTITMEKYVPSSPRKIMVVNRQAEPVTDIKITVSEIAFENAPDDWQLWASQRFGPLATGESDKDGNVQLRVPLEVNGEAVSRLRITIQGRIEQKGQDAYVQRKRLIIPREADGRVVVLTVSDEKPKEKYAFYDVAVDYLQSSELLSDSPQGLLKQFLKKPSLVILNRLLQVNDFNAATPLRFRGDWNLATDFDKKKSERSPVLVVPTEAGERVAILCDVRPKDASWETKPRLRSPPMAAFIFKTSDGSLVRMIGGWASSKGDYSHAMMNNLGGTDDYFVSTSAFEINGPFEYIQRWYQLGKEDKPAITFYGYANATGWSGKPGPSKPLAEFGYLDLKFNGKDLEHLVCGVLPNGTLAPRKLFWDGIHDQFIAPVRESVEGKPLYQIDLQNSHQFNPLEVEPGELIVAGGRRDYKNWHAWNCVIPKGQTARLRLFSVDESGDKPVETEYFTRKLSAGQHNLQLQLADDEKEESQSAAKLWIDDSTKESLTVPRVPVADVPSVAGVPISRTGKTELDLFNRATTQKQQRLIWRVELQGKSAD